MIAGIDANILTLILSDAGRFPDGVLHARERLDELHRMLRDGEIRPLVVPSIVVAEVCTHSAGSWTAYRSLLENPSLFRIVPFDIPDAIELSRLNKDYYAAKAPFDDADFPLANKKADRQIAATLKRHGCKSVFTHDNGLANACRFLGMKVITIDEMPLPEIGIESEPVDLFANLETSS